jgi:Phosphotransferase enzyme family
MTPEQITDEWLSAVFGADVRIAGSKRIGDGLVGMNIRYELESSGPDVPASVIAKLPSPDPTSRATGIALRNYEREVKFYTEIAPTVDIRVARCHHAAWHEDSGDFVLLMEDLSPAVQGNQITGCSLDHARVAVLELARLHGPRWGDPTLDEVDWLQRRSAGDAEQLTTLWGMFLPGFMGVYGARLSVDNREVIERFGEQLPQWLEGRNGALTVTHGDYRLDNLMFASDLGGSPVAAVDWQTPGHGAATGDVAYFLGAGPLPADRRAAERRLLDDYAEAISGYGVSIDGDQFWQQYCRDAYGGVIMAVIASQLVGASDRSEEMFLAMAERHTQHVLDVGSEQLI